MRRIFVNDVCGAWQAVRGVCLVIALGVSLVAAGCSFGASEEPNVSPVAGSPGLGDPYFPNRGNGGYDVERYDIDVRWDAGTGSIEATTTIELAFIDDLTSINLDFDGLTITELTVDGNPAEYRRRSGELTVLFDTPVEDGARSELAVSYQGVPQTIPGPYNGNYGWRSRDDVITTINEPFGASTWYPVNDHPTDRATYEISVETPVDYTVASNGQLVERQEVGDNRAVWRWRSDDPMMAYLSGVTIGKFEVVEAETTSGLPVRSFLPSDREVPQAVRDEIDRLPQLVEELETILGPYPFDSYGVTVLPTELGTAFETQTNSLFGIDTAADRTTMVHELAHQWFGNSVSIDGWNEMWLKEGLATYVERLHREAVDPTFDIDRWALRLHGDVESLPAPGDPGRTSMYDDEVYFRGALVVHALRLTVGDTDFFELLEEWAQRTTSESTATFAEFAASYGDPSVEQLVNTWVYEDRLPDLPG